MKRVLVITAALFAARAAAAAPHGTKARQEFERGAKAFQKQDYAGASAAFKASWGEEKDVETLFAWAQAERLQDHCKQAIDLYRMLDDYTLSPENRQLITSKRKECQLLLAQEKPAPEPDTTPPPEHTKPPDTDTPEPDTTPPDVAPPRVHKHVRHDESAGLHWYQDPLGDTLAGVGAAGLLGGGTLWIVSWHDSMKATTYSSAKPIGQLGTGFLIGGGALLAAGFIRYSLLPSDRGTVVTGWATPTSGGLAVLGRF
jgi:hypothetical protein